jgi:hypothetical protein
MNSNRCGRFLRAGSQSLVLAAVGFVIIGCTSPLIDRSPVRSILTRRKTPETDSKIFRSDLAVMPFADMDDERITIRYVRDCRYRSEADYDVRYYDLGFRREDVKSVDFIVVPFKETELLAHTMFSFGLADGRHFVISVEARLGADETYTAVAGAGRRYPLMYVIGDERDLILLRTAVRDVEVFLYKGKATPEQAQKLLVSMLNRANKLYREPEFYDTLTNNCTTNLVRHINEIRPGRIPYQLRVLFPGHSDRMAYDLGLLEIEGPFEYARAYAKVNDLAKLYADSPEFSKRIRRQ